MQKGHSRPMRGAPQRWLLEAACASLGNGCVLWPFGKDSDGAGKVLFGGKWMRATRAVMTIHENGLPEDKFVRSCRQSKLCCNPHHLKVFVKRAPAEFVYHTAGMTTPPSFCIRWPFLLSNTGYGELWDGDRHLQAHREVCRLAHGEPFENSDAAHSCGNRWCVNPGHLRWATRYENVQDTVSMGRVLRGEAAPSSKLSNESVLAVRRSHSTHAETARKFGVSVTTIHDIRSGNTWRHLL